jgi:hypothetical protein
MTPLVVYDKTRTVQENVHVRANHGEGSYYIVVAASAWVPHWPALQKADRVARTCLSTQRR